MSEPPRAARIAALADQCVQCGLCLPYCPTYGLDRTETESPRGRIALARGVARGSLIVDAGLRGHLDHCLGCLACERVCPSGVQYGALLAETRALLGPASPRVQRLGALLAKPAFVRAIARLARLTLAWRWLPALARRLPADSALRAALAAVPRPPAVRRLPATAA
ncbi:4Fe-4S dicluster domain-containing protein, partial [Mizugakiibacter sediminis]|uniref:4Fe-4S dicluster domain-containing protein n=1 Tax=Mizugakiibacter sediminis TaxID=1475481 RepID=UPI000E0966CD